MTKLWGKPSGMWTQMVLNFHIFKFHTTRFSHITHVTPKTPFPHPIWNFLHLQFHEQLEESHGCTTCQPTALPWQDPIFFYSTVFVHILLHLAIITYKENKRGTVRDTVLSRVQFLLHFFVVLGYDCLSVFVLCMPQPLRYILVCKLVFLSKSPLPSELSLLPLASLFFLSLPSLDVL